MSVAAAEDHVPSESHVPEELDDEDEEEASTHVAPHSRQGLFQFWDAEVGIEGVGRQHDFNPRYSDDVIIIHIG